MVILAMCGLSPINAAEDLFMIRRREFIAGLGSAAAWPVATAAQPASIPAIGHLSIVPEQQTGYLAAFNAGLAKAGFVKDLNVRLDFQIAIGPFERMKAAAADLVRRQPAVIVANNNGPLIRAAKSATDNIPIVFSFAGDPVKFGFVASLNRPGGNMTGFSGLSTVLLSKRIQLLHEIAPGTTTLTYLTDATAPFAGDEAREVISAGRALGLDVVVADISIQPNLEAIFASIAQQGFGAVLVGPYTLFGLQSNRDRILALAAQHKIPTSYVNQSWVRDGGLMSYSSTPDQSLPVLVDYVARILKGAKPDDLPVVQPTRYEFVINLKTAKTLGLTIPPNLLAVADEVIE
jgi:putative ABC transport system substrate-binding protein